MGTYSLNLDRRPKFVSTHLHYCSFWPAKEDNTRFDSVGTLTEYQETMIGFSHANVRCSEIV